MNKEKIGLNDLFLLASVFFVLSVTDTNLNSIISFNIMPKTIYIFAIIMLFYIMQIILSRRIVMDIIFITLLLRVPFYLVQPFLSSSINESFGANYLIVIMAPIIYQTVMILKIDEKKLIKFITRSAIIIIFLQLLTVYAISLRNSVLYYEFKTTLRIPIGSSNAIATILVCLYSMCLYDRLIFKLCAAIGVFLTLSNSGLIVIILITVFHNLYNCRQIITIKNILTICIIIIILINLIVMIQGNVYLTDLFSRYLKCINNYNSGNVDILSNGRIDIFTNAMVVIKKNPLIGSGIGYVENLKKVHNWILQGLVNGGILGLIIYIIPLCISLRECWSKRKNKYAYCLMIMIIASLIQGMVEPSYFTRNIEFFAWLFIGITLKKLKNIEI